MSDENNPERREAWERPADTEAAKYGFDRAEEPGSDGYIQVEIDGVMISAFESDGDVRVAVVDTAWDREDDLALRVALPPLGAESLGVGLLELARQARGEAHRGYVSRPKDLSDVAAKIREGRTVGRIDLSEMTGYPDALEAATEFISQLNEVKGLRFRSEYGSAVIFRTLTPSEEQDVLDEAQRSWDRTREMYEEAAEAALVPKDYSTKARIERFCEAERLPLPWDRPRIGDLR